MNRGDAETTAVEQAISAVVEGTLVTKWMVLAETVDDNGDTAFESLSSSSMSTWDKLGFLEFHRRFVEQDVEPMPRGDDE